MKRWATLLLAALTAFAAQAGWVTLSWDPSPGADGYRVYWGTQSRHYDRNRDVGPALSCTVTGLVNTITYYFAVTAYNGAGESDFSAEQSVTIPPLPPAEYLYLAPAPDILTWSIPAQSDTLCGYLVFRREVGLKHATVYHVTDPDARSLAMLGLLPGSTYRFWVVCYTEYRGREIKSASSEVLVYLKPSAPYAGPDLLRPPDLLDDGSRRIVFFRSGQ